MSHIPHLSLKGFQVDPALVRLLPRKLAYYHLVLPLAVDPDTDQISLAMAYADNPLVVSMFGQLLGAPVVPILVDAAEIRQALDRIWEAPQKPDSDTLTPAILTWGASPADAQVAQSVGHVLSVALAARVVDVQASDLDTVVMLTKQDEYSLTVIHTDDIESMVSFVRSAETPVLLIHRNSKAVQLEQFDLNRILLSLRGHSPDLSALELVIPLAKIHPAEVTVVAVADSVTATGRGQAARSVNRSMNHSLSVLLDPDQEPAQHLARCTDQITAAGLRGYLKLCQGDPVEQIGHEFDTGHYSLLVIIFEAYGHFIQQVITEVQQKKDNFAILVVKPTMPR